MLFKLSCKNIQKSFKDYAIYFFTLILGVAIFYVFNAIESQTVLLDVTASTQELIKLMTNILSGVSVFVSFVLGFLIIYASRFLMKRRNKEFGIYLTLGMGKRKISMILFMETLLIGLLSLVVGLGLGVVLSQLMSLLVANLFEADMTKFTFIFSKSACMKTLLYFGIMYLLVMIFNTINVSRCKLIDLLHSEKASEKVKLKNPVICAILFLIASCALGYAYYLVTGGVDQLDRVDKIFIPITLGIVSTFFIFFSLSGLLLQFVRHFPKFYYKGLNSFTLRQVSSKINTTVFSMTIICLMLFVTICVLSSSLSIKNSMTANLKTLAPIDIEFTKNLDYGMEAIEERGLTLEQIEDSKLSIKESLKRMQFDNSKYLKNILDFNLYATDEVQVKTTLGETFDKVSTRYPYLAYDSKEDFMKVSDYNKVAALYGLEELSLKENEYILVADYDQWVKIRNEALAVRTPITLLGKTYYPKYTTCKNGFLHISSNHINMGFFVVPDNAVDESVRSENILLANYKASTVAAKKEVEEVIRSLLKNPYMANSVLNMETKLSIYEASVGLGALVTFIGLYLGIIFLLASAAILALKELSESSDNKSRFAMLRKIGADEKMINQALFRQIAIFFLFPCIVAIIHSIFGILFCNHILESLGTEQLLPSILMTAIFLVAIYGGYFLITYFCSKNMIRESVSR